MSKKAYDFLCKHAHLGTHVKNIGPVKLNKNNDLYFVLLRAIVGQQLSTKVADIIWQRFLALFPSKYPEVSWLIAADKEQLRSVGLSYQKASYLKNIAQFGLDFTLDYNKLKKMNNDELIKYLTQIKGVGKWTVEMLMMFSLGREDVFSDGDLGIQQAMAQLFNLDIKNKKFKQNILNHADLFTPYKTLACMYLWRLKDNPAQLATKKTRGTL